MSRLDEIKARAEAATPGAWLEDGPWWTDDGGSEPTALPCVVDANRALVVFPPDATDVGMKRPEDRAANMAFIAHAREDVPWLVEQVDRLERWKVEALEVMSGLQALGKALGLQPGVRITGPSALAEVERLTAERDDMAWQRTQALNERDALAAQVAEGVHLTDVWVSDLATDAMVNAMDPKALEAINEQMKRLRELRAALADSEADTSEREARHRCEPYYSRSECGQCGWQEQWCATCSRQMCGCATETTDQDAIGADQ